MREYVLRRMLMVVPTALIAMVLVFGLIRLIPGDALVLMMGENKLAEGQSMDALKEKYGFDKPLHIQFVDYVVGVTQGNLGESFFTGRRVTEELKKRLPVTLELGIIAIVIGLLIAIPIGVISATKQDSWADHLLRGGAIMGVSIPSFWLATLIIVLPAIWFLYSPPIFYVSMADDLGEHIQMMLPPAIVLGIGLAAAVMRMTRAMMLEVLRQDYVRTARAKGLRERFVIYRHALKNALIPVVTLIGLQVNMLIGGTAVVESIYGLPGMGQLFLQAATLRDYQVIQGINRVVVVWIILVNLTVDLSYAFLDPRIRYK